MASSSFSLLPLLLLLVVVLQVIAQPQWCGKNYQQGQPAVDPGGHFAQPSHSAHSRLNFRCWPTQDPFLSSDPNGADVGVIVDLSLTNLMIPGSQPFSTSIVAKKGAMVSVTISSGSTQLATAQVGFNTTGTVVPISLSKLPVGLNEQTISCTATLSKNTFKTTASIRRLPEPSNGATSVTKMDLRTGTLLARPGNSKQFSPIIPFGFYTSFSDYLALNASALVDSAKASGRNTIHPIPTFDNLTALDVVLQKMEEAQMWLMYDMRGTFMNLSSVREETNRIKNYPYLLLWYTADEPDGWSYPHNSTRLAGDLINSLDPYHPVSLVLNCFDYFFETYTEGASIILQDTYPVDIQATFSRVWGTACNTTLGDCGCDDCIGSFTDISTRVDTFHQRLSVDGRSRGTAVWSVPQHFGNESYWPRFPTPNEFILQTILSLNHKSTGLISWDEAPSTPQPLIDSASILGHALPTITPFLTSPKSIFVNQQQGNVDVASWTLGSQTLILATNLGSGNSSISLGDVSQGGGGAKNVQELLNTGAEVVELGGGELRIDFLALGSLGVVFNF